MNQQESPSASVAIITATYNRCQDVVSLLSQIAQLDYDHNLIQVIVVDNGSTDGTVERVRGEFPYVELIENPRNLGTAVGFNIGLRAALESDFQARYLWLLDSDVILEPQSLAPLVTAAENDPKIGVIGSAVYDPKQKERLVAAGLRVVPESNEITFVIPDEQTQDLVDVDLIAACSLMVTSEACRRVGLWDEQMILYWGDTDWCVRFLRHGYRVVCHQKSRAWHRDWTDVDRGFFTPVYLHDHIRGALLYAVRHAPNNSLASARKLLLKSYLRAAMEQLTMRLAFASGYEWAIKDFLAATFVQRDFESIVGYPLLPTTASIAEKLAGECATDSKNLSENPSPEYGGGGFEITIVGHCAPDVKNQLLDDLRKHFKDIQWDDATTEKSQKRLAAPTAAELIRQAGEFMIGLVKLPFRPTVQVLPTARPSLANLVTAKYTVFVDGQGRGLVYRNRVIVGVAKMLATLVRGLRIAYFDLPKAMKTQQLQDAIHAVEKPLELSTRQTASASTSEILPTGQA